MPTPLQFTPRVAPRIYLAGSPVPPLRALAHGRRDAGRAQHLTMRWSERLAGLVPYFL